VAAICDLGADHQVAVFIDDPAPAIATKLHAAGVHHRHLRTTT
jgi:hypothetical protein